MSRSKKIYVLLGVLAVLCIVTFAVSRYETRQEEIRTSDETILSIDPEAVTELSWSNETGDYAFHKDDDAWVYDDDEEFPVDEAKILAQLEQFEDFRAAFTIENVTDPGQYGLDDPVASIHITAGETELEMTLGDYSTMDSQRYVSTGDGNVYLAAHDPMDEFGAVSDDMIANDETPELDKVTSIAFSGKEAYDVAYAEESSDSYCDEDVYFASVGEKTLPLDTSKVETYLRSISGLELTDFVNYRAAADDLAGYGLDEPEVSVTVAYTAEDEDGESTDEIFTLHIARDPEEAAAAAQKAAEEDGSEDEEADEEEETITAYARVGESPIIYSISADDYRALSAAGSDDLRHSEIVTVSLDSMTGIDIVLEGVSYELSRVSEPDDNSEYGVWSCGGEEIDVSDLAGALSEVKAEEFTADKASDREEISLVFHLDNDSIPEVGAVLYRVDGERCLAVVDGESFAYVSRASAVELIEAVNTIVL